MIYFKRTFDLVFSFLILIILHPFLIFISIIILIIDGRPIIYYHKRLGINKTTFMFYKFRTMSNGESLSAKHDELRITSLG